MHDTFCRLLDFGMALIHKSKIIIGKLIVLKEVKCFQRIKFCAWAIFLAKTNSKATSPCFGPVHMSPGQ